ncbi:hypothetical protein ES319_D04G195900v1 [Gossypium barbadense]|uniref:AMP-dependent synthetase/ligase domain-containing protein n=1 Tax=Gossypium barbadense TaxID=3634 RepID=A0A5J5RXK2_GOSBA|nr:hypothetical protein ES319_D04G195900v1 [Gossypium barbadense]
MNVSNGEIDAALGPNIPEIYELHFAVPMAGAVFSPLNIHQDSTALAAQFKLLEAKVIFIDYQFLNLVIEAFEILVKTCTDFEFPLVVLMLETDPDAKTAADDHQFLGYKTYDSLLNVENNSGFEILRPKGEFDPISIVFTSGTTGEPKGVVHIPMYHCNGWCFTWSTAALGGANICLRTYDSKFIFDAIVEYNVTNLGGATPVLSLIANANQNPLPFKVNIMTGGPGTVYPWWPEYGSFSLQQQAKIKALHGLNHMLMAAVDVKDPVTMESVPFDGFTLGEGMFRGNTVTKGYYKEPEKTEVAFMGGWFHTGDIAVRHPDGSIEVKDRKLDLIVSGGKKISTVDVEAVLFSHPAVFEAGVVGKPDKVVGETVSAGYMVPETVVFDDLPFTSTGKLKKAVLRERAKALV